MTNQTCRTESDSCIPEELDEEKLDGDRLEDVIWSPKMLEWIHFILYCLS